MKHKIQKIGLISHNYWTKDAHGLMGYASNAAILNQACDAEKCDTVLYSLFTWDFRSKLPRTTASLFHDLRHVRCIIMEVGDCFGGDQTERTVEIWLKGRSNAIKRQQKCASSKEAAYCGESFMKDEFPTRHVENALLMICGESNLVNMPRSGGVADPFEFNKRLEQESVKLILNPIHDYMVRPEMCKKREYYSQNGRTVVSVWNKGKRAWDKEKNKYSDRPISESWLPWTVFHDGVNRTDVVKELQSPIARRPDIMLGILSLPDLLD